MNTSIIDLIKEVYNFDSYEDFIKRYPLNSTHKTKEVEGRYVAHLGAVFRNFKTPRGSLYGASLLDVIKSRDEDIEVLKPLYEEMVLENSPKLELYFPLDENVAYFVDELGYSIVGQVPVYAKILKHNHLLNLNPIFRSLVVGIFKLYNKISTLRNKKGEIADLSMREVESFDGDLEDLFDRFSDEYGIMSVRDLKLLEEKKKGSNKFLIEARDGDNLRGYMLLKYIERKEIKYLMVMDIFSDSKEVFRALFEELDKRAKDMDVSLISVWHNEKFSDILREYGYSFGKSLITVLSKTSCDFSISSLSDWYLMPIEGEIY